MQRKVLYYFFQENERKYNLFKVTVNGYRLQEGFGYSELQIETRLIRTVCEKRMNEMLQRGFYFGRPLTRYKYPEIVEQPNFQKMFKKEIEAFKIIKENDEKIIIYRGWEVV